MWSKDLGRTLDHLETRPDIAHDKMAFMGFSWGAQMGAILPAVEARLKAVLLIVGGFNLQKALPEVEPINFAPHITAPTLMLNGKYDFSTQPKRLRCRCFVSWGTTGSEASRRL